MAKVIIRNITVDEEFVMSKLLMEYSREGKILFITDKPKLVDELSNINKDKLVVECTTNLDQAGINKLRNNNSDVKNVIIHSGRIIDRYYNELLNIKRVKAKEYFEGWNDVTVTILSKNEGKNAIMSNNDKINGIPAYQPQVRVSRKWKGTYNHK